MARTLVTGPTLEPVTLDEIKDHIRISTTVSATEDTLLLSFIKVARNWCEKYQSRSYLDQTWDMLIDTWPVGDIITVPLPPLQSVTYVYYYGTGGTANTMTASTYIVDTDGEPGRVALAYGETWPSETLRPINGVKVRFVCGYGSTASVVPDGVKEAIKLIVGDLYEHREDSDTWGQSKILADTTITYGVKGLLNLERLWPV